MNVAESDSENVLPEVYTCTCAVHWVISFITSRPVCVYSSSQLRELWFYDLFMYMYINTCTLIHALCMYYVMLMMTKKPETAVQGCTFSFWHHIISVHGNSQHSIN